MEQVDGDAGSGICHELPSAVEAMIRLEFGMETADIRGMRVGRSNESVGSTRLFNFWLSLASATWSLPPLPKSAGKRNPSGEYNVQRDDPKRRKPVR